LMFHACYVFQEPMILDDFVLASYVIVINN
jgi:hypothetical protein